MDKSDEKIGHEVSASDAELCELIEFLEGLCDQTTTAVDERYVSLGEYSPYSSLDSKTAAAYDGEYAAYRSLLEESIALKQALVDAYDLLECSMVGNCIDGTLFKSLLDLCESYRKPVPEEGSAKPRKSYKRALGFDAVGFSGLETDPRRIETGRNATRVTWPKGADVLEAESAFMEASSGTHGGKVRYRGKNGNYYIGLNGRRIRKR